MNIQSFSISKLDRSAVRGSMKTAIVIRDDLVYECGSKERGLPYLLSIYDGRPFAYAGSCSGFGMAVVAKAAKQCGTYALIYAQESATDGGRKLAMKYGARVRIGRCSMSELTAKLSADDTTVISYGAACDGMIEQMSTIMAEQWSMVLMAGQLPWPNEIWLACGSCCLLQSYYRAFMKLDKCYPQFVLIQVGSTLWPDLIAPPAGWKGLPPRIIVDPLGYNRIPNVIPPYPAVANYDGKVWRHYIANAEDGIVRYIHNTAA